MKFKYVLNVLLFVILGFVFYVFIQKNNIYSNIEGLDNPDMSVIMNGSDSFCEINQENGGNLENSCNKLINILSFEYNFLRTLILLIFIPYILIKHLILDFIN